jgi:hypothetical protein
MNRFRFTTTKAGKCDVIVTLFTKDNIWLLQRSLTFDIKPTVKELKQTYKPCKKDGAYYIRITTTPSCLVKTYKL